MARAGLIDEAIKPSKYLPPGVLVVFISLAGVLIGLFTYEQKWLYGTSFAIIATYISIKFRSDHFSGYLLRRHLMGAYIFQEQLDRWGEGTEDGFIAATNAASEYCDLKANRRVVRIQAIIVNIAIILGIVYLYNLLIIKQ